MKQQSPIANSGELEVSVMRQYILLLGIIQISHRDLYPGAIIATYITAADFSRQTQVYQKGKGEYIDDIINQSGKRKKKAYVIRIAISIRYVLYHCS
jgi:hypothetical protein